MENDKTREKRRDFREEKERKRGGKKEKKEEEGGNIATKVRRRTRFKLKKGCVPILHYIPPGRTPEEI